MNARQLQQLSKPQLIAIILRQEPTNNPAEQALRFVVIDRRITPGTSSTRSRQWCKSIWTTIATLTQQGRSLF